MKLSIHGSRLKLKMFAERLCCVGSELIKRLLGRRPADPTKDPYAAVGAPKKPKRPQLSGAVALAEPDEE